MIENTDTTALEAAGIHVTFIEDDNGDILSFCPGPHADGQRPLWRIDVFTINIGCPMRVEFAIIYLHPRYPWQDDGRVKLRLVRVDGHQRRRVGAGFCWETDWHEYRVPMTMHDELGAASLAFYAHVIPWMERLTNNA
jgi:hypothetical protein